LDIHSRIELASTIFGNVTNIVRKRGLFMQLAS